MRKRGRKLDGDEKKENVEVDENMWMKRKVMLNG
jgi:hypothetical protein